MTRFGMGEPEMERIAGLMDDCLHRNRTVTADCAALRREFARIRYGFAATDLSST